jgi:hypothetical protein
MTAFRKVAVAGLIAATALTAAACGSGQISQTAVQAPAVNGNQANVGPIALRDVRIDYPGALGANGGETSSATNATTTNVKGGHAVLLFTAINNSASRPDRLVTITSEVGDATMHPLAGSTDNALPIDGKLVAMRMPADPTAAQRHADTTTGTAPIYVTIDNLNRDLTPGLTIGVQFTFEHAGAIDVRVPIDAGAAQRK